MNTSIFTPMSPVLAHYAAPKSIAQYAGPAYGPSGDLTSDQQRRLQDATDNAVGILLFWSAISVVSAGVCAYHGSKRNHGELLPAIGWGLLGGLFPVVGPVVALAQGYAKPA